VSTFVTGRFVVTRRRAFVVARSSSRVHRRRRSPSSFGVADFSPMAPDRSPSFFQRRFGVAVG
jgi:hypothetical protein